MKLQRTKLQLDKRLPRSAIELIRVLGFRPTNERRRMQRDGFGFATGTSFMLYFGNATSSIVQK